MTAAITEHEAKGGKTTPRNHFRNGLAWLLIAALSLPPARAGEEHTDPAVTGRQAQAFGQELSASFAAEAGTVQDGVITVPTLKDGAFRDDGGARVEVRELFPGTSAAAKRPPRYYFPDAREPDVTTLQGLHASGDAMDKTGATAKRSLWDDAHSAKPSVSGAAYKVLLDAADRSRPDFSADPLLESAKKTYAAIDPIAAGFGDCAEETAFRRGKTTAHLPDYRHCERVRDESAACEVLHDYRASVIRHHDGPYNLRPCGDGCVELWIGKVGDNYWKGWCAIHEVSTQVRVDNPRAIVSARLEYVKWDDYMQIRVGDPGRETTVWSGPYGARFPPETEGRCELSTSWERNPGVDVTRYFRDVAPGAVVSFKIRVSVSGAGEGYGRIRIRYDAEKSVSGDRWSPQRCVDAARAAADSGFAGSEITCVEAPEDSAGCVVVDGAKICASWLEPSPLPGVPRLCRKARVKTDYSFYKGRMDCFRDPAGERHCPYNPGGRLDSCTTFEKDPRCGFIASTCVEGARDKDGSCYVQEDTYDCGDDVAIATLKKESRYRCAGPIRCMGDDCIDPRTSQSTDFARAAALLHAAEFATRDMACSGRRGTAKPSGDEDVVCAAFAGEAGECKIAVGGVQDCCEKPAGVSLTDYLEMIMLTPKLDAAVMALEKGTAVRSAYQLLRDPLLEGWTKLTRPFTAYIENISGAVDTLPSAGKLGAGLVDRLKAKAKDLLVDIMSSSGGGMTEAAAEATASQMVEGAATALGAAMTAYAAYQVATVMVKMAWKCEKKEFEINAKRALKSCSHVGSYCRSRALGACVEKREVYCCFNSPLSRIVQEQVRSQLGMDFGDAKHPHCEGIPFTELKKVDWNAVDLDEWLGILQSGGRLPDPGAIDMESLTGSGSVFDTDGTRGNARERTVQRLRGIDVDARRREAAGGIALRPRGIDVQAVEHLEKKQRRQSGELDKTRRELTEKRRESAKIHGKISALEKKKSAEEKAVAQEKERQKKVEAHYEQVYRQVVEGEGDCAPPDFPRFSLFPGDEIPCGQDFMIFDVETWTTIIEVESGTWKPIDKPGTQPRDREWIPFAEWKHRFDGARGRERQKAAGRLSALSSELDKTTRALTEKRRESAKIHGEISALEAKERRQSGELGKTRRELTEKRRESAKIHGEISP